MNKKTKFKVNKEDVGCTKGTSIDKEDRKANPKRRSSYSKDTVNKLEAKFGKNDVTWYLKYPELARDVSNIAQNYIPGIPRTGEFRIFAGGKVGLTVPAGLRLGLIITPGMADTSADGFNMSMKSLWLQMHRKYRGIGTYQSADLGAVVFSILAVFAFIAEGERAYGVCAHYESRNRTIPTAYENMLNWDFTGLRSDLANFRYQLNRIIKKASILCLPKGLPAFDDVIQMFSNLFKDRDTIRAQVFAAYQKAVWTYDPTSINTGSAVKGDIVSQVWNNSSYLLKLESMVDALVLDDDVARICSDIIACFENDIQTLLPLPEDYTVLPVYHEVRSLQMHNLRCARSAVYISNKYAQAYFTGTTGVTGGDGLWVYQEDNTIKFRTYLVPSNTVAYYTSGANNTPYAELTANSLHAGSVVPGIYDIWKDMATGDDILEMTRLSSTGEIVELPASVPSGKSAYSIHLYHGLYIVDSVEIITVNNDLTANVPFYGMMAFKQAVSNTSNLQDFVMVISGIDNAPQIFSYDGNDDFQEPDNFSIIGGIDNLIFITNRDLEQVHDVCILSEYQFTNTLIK